MIQDVKFGGPKIDPEGGVQNPLKSVRTGGTPRKRRFSHITMAFHRMLFLPPGGGEGGYPPGGGSRGSRGGVPDPTSDVQNMTCHMSHHAWIGVEHHVQNSVRKYHILKVTFQVLQEDHCFRPGGVSTDTNNPSNGDPCS